MLVSILSFAALAVPPTPGPAPSQADPAELFQEAYCPLHWRERWDAVADLNGDEIPDLIGYGSSSFALGEPFYGVIIRGYLGNGAGGFDLVWDFPIDVGTNAVYSVNDIVVADLNGDDRSDFVFSGGHGTWCFTAHPTDPQVAPSFYGFFNQGVDEVAVGDLDANGLDDVYLGPYSGTIVFNYGPQQLVGVGTAAVDRANSPAPIIAEFNGDGRPDIVATHYQGTYIHPVAGGTVFDPIVLPFVAADSWDRLAAGDVDQDGDLDLVHFDTSTREYRVIRRIGPDDYDIEDWLVGGPATELVDVDGDGDLDGVMCEENLVTDVHEFIVSLNDGSGSFGPALRVAALDGDRIAGVIDVDGDGDCDLVGGRCVLFNLAEVGSPFCESTASTPATLAASGSASLGRGNLVLEGSQLPASSFGHTFYGPGTQAAPLGGGTLCVGGSWIRRLPVTAANVSGQSSIAFDLSQIPAQGPGACLPGDTRYFQLWYRDPQTFSNLTNAYAITFAP